MKKLLCVVLALMLAGSAALAGPPKLSNKLFSYAKQALACLSDGDYDALEALPFSGNAPDAVGWQDLAARFDDLSGVQSDYAVGFWTGKIWVVAVPVHPPEDGSVEALAFSSKDGSAFNGCRYATWSQVEQAYSDSSRVVWDQEYVGGDAMIVADG